MQFVSDATFDGETSSKPICDWRLVLVEKPQFLRSTFSEFRKWGADACLVVGRGRGARLTAVKFSD